MRLVVTSDPAVAMRGLDRTQASLDLTLPGRSPNCPEKVRYTLGASLINSHNWFHEMKTKSNQAEEWERPYFDTLASIKAWVPLVPGMTLK